MLFQLALALASCPTAPQGAQLEILHSERAPYNTLPGRPGWLVHEVNWFEIASDGQYLVELASDPGDQRALVLNGHPRLVVGDEAPWKPAESITHLGGRTQSLDAEGRILARVFTGHTREYLARYEDGAWVALSKSGRVIPGYPALVHEKTQALQTPAGRRIAGSFELSGTAAGQDAVLLDGARVLAQRGVDRPTGLPSGSNDPWWSFGRPMISADGQDWLVSGEVGVGAAGRQVLALNGQALVEQHQSLPGGVFLDTVKGVSGYGLLPGGSWWATGTNFGAQAHWLLRDGAIVAKSGDPISAGDARVWAHGLGNLLYGTDGQHEVLAGVAEDPQGGTGWVVLVDGQLVIEEGDPIDWNGDGLLNDGIEFDSFASGMLPQFDRMGRLWMLMAVREPSSGTSRIESLVRLQLGGPKVELAGLTAGQQATVTVRGGEALAPAHLAWSVRPGPGQRVASPFGPVWIEVGPIGLNRASVSLDAAGQASLTIQVPPAAAGLPFTVQSLVFESQQVSISPPLVRVVQ
ncbi:MAG: hypothetical protein CMJ94_03915 [Planctomycetes bacterium]|nr:hypothetical protein [Planctomycetota bacterium]